MPIEKIDHGWGHQHPVKQMENQIVDSYLAPLLLDPRRTLIINSTWYSERIHEQVRQRLEQQPPDRLILVSLLDAAIVRPQQFDDLIQDIRCMGAYAGPDYVDFWCLVVAQHMVLPDLDLTATHNIDTAFMCLNRKPHWHRVRLFDQIEAAGLLDQGLVSLGGTDGQAQHLLAQDAGSCDLAPNAGTEQTGILNDIMSLGHVSNWCRHFLNVVTETQFDVSGTMFITEKTYKAILGLRPFLIYASDGGRRLLEQLGFKPYVEDFRDITDLDLSLPENMVPFLCKLAETGPAYWRTKLLDLSPKMSYNKQRFYQHVIEQKLKIQRGIQCQI